jgi:hypothetical protein
MRSVVRKEGELLCGMKMSIKRFTGVVCTADLYGPALLADPDQFLDRCILGAVGLVEGYVFGIVGASANQQPSAHPLLWICGEPQARPLLGAPLAGVLRRKNHGPGILGQSLGEPLYLLLASS